MLEVATEEEELPKVDLDTSLLLTQGACDSPDTTP